MPAPADQSLSGTPTRGAGMPWPDIVAGLSLAGLLLPEAVAYSGIGNLPPQAGVIALFAGLVCYGLFGTSRFAIVSATSSSAAVLAAASAEVATGDSQLRLVLAVGLVLITGLFMLLAGIFKIGSISDFIAKPVLRGFAFGLAVVIIFKQLAQVLGVHPQHADLFRFVAELLSQFAHWNWAGGIVTVIALALLVILGRIPYVPGGLLVIAFGIAAEKWGNLTQYGIGHVGDIHLDLVVPTLPALSNANWSRLGELSVALVLILYAESYSSIRSFAMKHGDPVSPNRDLLALGASNLLSGLFHGMPVGAGYSATSANEAAGATSRAAGWFSAAALLIIVLTLLPTIALTPDPVLAAIVMHAVGHTLRLRTFRPYFEWHRDRLIVCAATLAVMVFGVMDGLLIAIGFSLLMLLRRLSESSVTVLGRLGDGHDFVSLKLRTDARAIDGVLIVRPDTALFFANAERMMGQVRRDLEVSGNDVKIVVLSLEETPDLDSSSVEAINDFCAALLAKEKQILFARLKPGAQEVLKRAAIKGLLEEALSTLSVDDTVKIAQNLLAERWKS